MRLFADTPASKKRGERSPLITNIAVSCQDPYPSASKPGINTTAGRASIPNNVPQSQASSPAMDMPSGPDTRKLPSGRTAAEVFGRDLHGSSSRPPSAASANTSSLAEDKENVPGRHQNIPRIPRASMGRKLDFSSQRTSEPAAGSTPSDPASEASPIFSPMQMDSQPRVPVPPVPSFLKQRAQANMGMGSTQQPQGSAGSEPGSSLSSGSSPSVPNVPGVLSSSVTALQHLAGRAAQEAAASRGADEETAMQVRTRAQ